MNKCDQLLEQANQVGSWASENQDCEIDDLTEMEVIWENSQGMEFSESVDGIELYSKLSDKIIELSKFIDENIDIGKCYPNGFPVISKG